MTTKGQDTPGDSWINSHSIKDQAVTLKTRPSGTVTDGIAISQEAFLEVRVGAVTSSFLHKLMSHVADGTVKLLATSVAPEPTPDCRTCAHLYPDSGTVRRCGTACVNGDQYQPAPAVVLWRTE